MNYYIDFDHTLFDTKQLVERMLSAIVKTSKIDLMEDCNLLFNREHIYNIYELAKFLSNKYNLIESDLILAINKVLNNCADLIYPDALLFIKKLRKSNHKIYLLSYYEQGLQYQMAKITGSNISDLFDGIIITKTLKYNLDIDYTNGIFIDDKPSDLIGLNAKSPKKVIRLNRKNHTYSDVELHIDIEEYESFDEIILD